MAYRIDGFKQIEGFYSWVFSNPDKIRPTHISLYLFLWNQNNRALWCEWFKCPYDLAMQGACIGNNNTYYKCLDELQNWGLIEYKKGINNFKAPLISLKLLYENEQVTEQVTVPQCEQQTAQQYVQQPAQQHVYIYNYIHNNIELINSNFKKLESFILSLNNKNNIDFECLENFIPILETWFKYKSERKEKYKTNSSKEQFYKNLLKLSNSNFETAEKIINQSIGNNWAGIFELKILKNNCPAQEQKRILPERLDISGYEYIPAN